MNPSLKTLLYFYGFAVSLDPTLGKINNGTEPGSERKMRLLNVFELVQFPNDPCVTGSLNSSGVCYTATECTGLGGTLGSACASGFGVCCTFTAGCDSSVSINNTYFTGSSSSLTSPCRVSVCRASEDICQFRLDFDELEINGPVSTAASTTNTRCLDATFTATSQGKSSGNTICGKNKGHHMILEASPSCNILEFNWLTGTATWNIKISQLECGARWSPQSGCTQWFTGVTGTLQSYNFAGGQHLANQDYSICIRQEAGYCNIEYTADTFKISLGVSDITTDPYTFANTHSGVDPAGCQTDYITIPVGGATAGANANENVFCGVFLNPASAQQANAVVKSSETPFRIRVNFDGTENTNPDETDQTNPANLGFQIKYVQTAC